MVHMKYQNNAIFVNRTSMSAKSLRSLSLILGFWLKTKVKGFNYVIHQWCTQPLMCMIWYY